MRRLAIAVMLPAVLTGCAGMSGLDGESKFACKAPEGVTCSSLSGVYANAVANNLPGLRKGGVGEEQAVPPAKSGGITGRAPSSGDPIRTAPKVLRIWIAPWEDADGDLHDQSYIYVVADPGRWVIEHNRRRIMDRYMPTFIQPGQGNPAQKTSTPVPQQAGGGVVLPGAQGYAPVMPDQAGSGER
ncbi:type IV conjugative transfer system lipoprotein TraV [Pelomicrobium methylotrophicum]|uniref:Type IV conjugative transfer system lipoprotein TraV n=1 Tax=Pelomicrobium methylotrophicum TaxID=2602750 RepID=A0A5C7EIJ8_9PROT|nr:type IV conjugative transfer system lipoprotein TraV [Pelomicrobium methylotrophicum]TXF11203.1 type IV conjugative transfer system lipoprotein TraV [Pelomicrobium methylotrophicum]